MKSMRLKTFLLKLSQEAPFEPKVAIVGNGHILTTLEGITWLGALSDVVLDHAYVLDSGDEYSYITLLWEALNKKKHGKEK